MNTFEILAGRTWQVWADGLAPTAEWEIGEVEIGDKDEFRWDTRNLTLGSRKIKMIACDVDLGTLTERDPMPKKLTVWFEGSEPPVTMTITRTTTGSDGKNKPRVVMKNGKRISLDETKIYIRAERLGGGHK